MANELRLTVSAVIERDEHYLFVRNRKSGLWSLPSGKLEYKETPTQALIRECRQEIGAYVDVIGLIGIYQFNSMHDNWITDFAHQCRLRGEPRIVRPKEIDKIEWLTLEDIYELKRKRELRSGRVQIDPIEDFLKKGRPELPSDLIKKPRTR